MTNNKPSANSDEKAFEAFFLEEINLGNEVDEPVAYTKEDCRLSWLAALEQARKHKRCSGQTIDASEDFKDAGLETGLPISLEAMMDECDKLAQSAGKGRAEIESTPHFFVASVQIDINKWRNETGKTRREAVKNLLEKLKEASK